jgi:hypothetical protein
MKFNALFMFIVLMITLAGCDNVTVKSAGLQEVLISQGFVDDNTYRIVCRGYPLEGLKGLQQAESSKRAALLHAYYVIKQVFNESVAPDRDGRTEKIEYMSDHAVLNYVVHKKGLKKMVITGSKPETKQEIKPAAETEKKPETTNEVK